MSQPPDDRIRLQHMLDAARAAVEFAKGRKQSDLAHDLQFAFALVKAIEIVGKAASQVSDSCRESNSQLAWDEMRGIRNRLVHAYYDINYAILWATTTKSLPILIDHLEAILGKDEPEQRELPGSR